MVVRGKELVHQTARRFDFPVNIYQGANTLEAQSNVTIASIATLYSRRHIPPARLVIVDEAHLSFGESYEWLLENLPADTFIVGTTATPYNRKGFKHIADEIIYPISITELQEQGYLVKGRYFSVERPDLSQIKMVGDDFNNGDLSRVMQTRLCADTVSSWRKHAEGRPTIVFCVNVRHAEKLAALYNSSGIKTAVIEATTPDDMRRQLFSDLAAGRINCLSSVGVLTTGVDIPEVSCLQILRPTMSEALWFQMLGRGTRTAPGKSDFLVLDHSTNTERFGFIEDERKGDLEAQPKISRREAQINISTCTKCGAIYRGRGACPCCGEEIEIIKKEPEIKPGELKEIKRQEAQMKKINYLVSKALQRGYKRGWVMYQLQEKFGVDAGMELYRKHVKNISWPDQPQNITDSLPKSF
jgi:superfamily II DNA or RNA helicase